MISPYATLQGEVRILGQATVLDAPRLKGRVYVADHATIGCQAILEGDIRICHHSIVNGHASIRGTITIGGYSNVSDHTQIKGQRVSLHSSKMFDRAILSGHVHMAQSTLEGNAQIQFPQEKLLVCITHIHMWSNVP